MSNAPPDDVPPADDVGGGYSRDHLLRERVSAGTAVAEVRSRLPMPAYASVEPAQWKVLTEAIWPSAKSAEAVCMAIEYCAARKLDPFKRPVHIVPMWNSQLGCMVETVWPGISEIQTTAARTGQWAGMDEPRFGPIVRQTFHGRVGKRGYEKDIAVEMEFPEWCAITVYRMMGGVRCPFTEPVYWTEAYGRQGKTSVPNDMWEKRPRGQLIKCAKAATLRAAFPEEIGSDFAAEEMEGKIIDAGGVVIEGTAAPVVNLPPPADKLDGLETLGDQLARAERERETVPVTRAADGTPAAQAAAERPKPPVADHEPPPAPEPAQVAPTPSREEAAAQWVETQVAMLGKLTEGTALFKWIDAPATLKARDRIKVNAPALAARLDGAVSAAQDRIANLTMQRAMTP